jgi:LDH2 family malate/lactate/ureidoglycolate dehydrogenase
MPIAPDSLRTFSTAAFKAAGMAADDAYLCADTLVQADLWGHQSHGVLRLSWYLARLKSGVCSVTAQPETVVDGGAIAVIEGHDAMGQVVTAHATNSAITRAKKHGIGAVAVRHSGHFGTAQYFTRMAAREDCIGFLSTNTSPAMAPWGGRIKTVGNNPWSWAAPAGRHAPMVLDIANTAVARGKIYLARQRGETIPEGWAIDQAGKPTTDPQAAIDGVILPMAGHKGYAVSVIMDMLSGVLPGSGFGTEVHGPYQAQHKSNAGHLMIVLNIAAFQPMAEFHQRIEAQIAELKSTPLAPGAEEIFYPGEIEARNDVLNRRDGLMLPDDTITDLKKVGAEYGLSPPF